MKKPKITITITKEDSGYSAHALVDNISINTQGETWEELKNDREIQDYNWSNI